MPHVPRAPSQSLSIVPFASALERSERTAAGYDPSVWLYVPNTYEEYRYVLGTKGARPLVCLGVNPSTAAPDNLDPTLKSVARIAAANGFDSWLMLNVYAQRATRPDDMDVERNEALCVENLAALRWVLARAGARPTLWAAWGAVIEKRSYLPLCVREMVEIGREFDARWVCAGRCSKAGHPHHPLYLRRDEPLRPFDILSHLKCPCGGDGPHGRTGEFHRG